MAKRTTHRNKAGKKLYAVRDKSGKFKEIQAYKRAHARDLRKRSKPATTVTKVIMVPRDHKLHLDLDLPADWPTGEARVTVALASPRMKDQKTAIESLRVLSRAGGVSSIPDPLEWQRDVRQDRELPRGE